MTCIGDKNETQDSKSSNVQASFRDRCSILVRINDDIIASSSNCFPKSVINVRIYVPEDTTAFIR